MTSEEIDTEKIKHLINEYANHNAKLERVISEIDTQFEKSLKGVNQTEK